MKESPADLGSQQEKAGHRVAPAGRRVDGGLVKRIGVLVLLLQLQRCRVKLHRGLVEQSVVGKVKVNHALMFDCQDGQCEIEMSAESGNQLVESV